MKHKKHTEVEAKKDNINNLIGNTEKKLNDLSKASQEIIPSFQEFKDVFDKNNFVFEEFGKMAEEKRIKALAILDGLYKQIENEIIKNNGVDNEQYYILINHKDLYNLYEATDLFVDIYGLTAQGLYGGEKRLLGFKLLIYGDIKKPEIVRKL